MAGMSQRITLAHIAAAAGVSVATVSVVLSRREGSIKVGDDTRKRVLDQARKLGYRANTTAQSLRLGRSRTVGVALDDITVPFLAEIIHAAARALRQADHGCLLIDLPPGSESRRAGLELFQSGRVDAVLLAGATSTVDDLTIRSIARQGLPVVLVERTLAAPGVTSLTIDNSLGGGLAVGHLIASGRKSLACITGPAGNAVAQERLAGARLAAQAGEVALRPNLIVAGDWSLESGSAAMAALIATGRPIDAVFAANDMMAVGALRVLRDLGRRVPGDIAVIGYDDLPLAAFVDPPLSTIRQSAAAMGREAARLILAALGQPTGEATPETLRPELVVRSSTRKIP